MVNESSYEHIGVTRRGDVLEVRLQGPHPLNGFNAGMHADFARVFRDIRHDDAKVVVLTAIGDSFSVSGDLAWYVNQTTADRVRVTAEVRAIIGDMVSLPQPLVVRLNGSAAGLGASILSFADFIVAVEGATVSDRHTAMGLVAGDGAAMTLPLTWGLHRAKEFFLLHRDFTVEELHTMGVVSKVVPRSELDAATDDIVQRLVAQPARAVQWTKMVLNRMLTFSSLLSTDAAQAHQGWSWHHEPAQQAIRELRASLESS